MHNAYLNTEEILDRSMYRIGKPEESFEGEGIIVFNTLSWKRNATVEVQFTEENLQQYEVIDLATKQKVESFRDGYKLYFVAKGLPSLGYKKYRLQPIAKQDEAKNNGLKVSDNSIENQFYKITFDKTTNKILSIIDKKSDKELIDKNNPLGFNQPLMEKFQDNQTFSQLNFTNEKIEIKNESPVKVILSIKRDDELFEDTKYILWNNVDRIDIEQKVNTSKLKPTEKLEEYAVAFPFKIDNQEIRPEIIGGFIDPEKDKLPGTTKEGFSIRRSVALYNNNQSISWTSLDARVIRLRDHNNQKVLISSLVNNFPKNWNRYEENAGEIVFRYSFTNQKEKFNPTFTSRFGWEINTPLIVRKSWYRTEPIEQSYFKIDNPDLNLLTVIPSEKNDFFLLRVQNMNPYNDASGNISSEFIKNNTAMSVTYLGEETKKLKVNGDSVKVDLRPNEIATIKISLKENGTVSK